MPLRNNDQKIAEYTNMKKIYLKKGRERSLEKRHPWIYSGAIERMPEGLQSGEIIEICAHDKTFLAKGAFSRSSSIPVKVWTFQEEEEINKEFFRRKLSDASLLRKKIYGNDLPEAYRLVNAESDAMPGLIADIYGKYAVIQITSAGMDHFRDMIGELLLDYAAGVYERSDVESREKDFLEQRKGHLAGEELPQEILFTENGIRFAMDPVNGHKTGFYLDQKESRKTVMNCLKGCRNVLNTFAYTGGFGLAALKGGAEKVLNIDSSLPALEQARKNAVLNGFTEEEFLTECADVFSFLRKCRDCGKTFDAIILDPPKFAESIKQKEKAARAYKDINLLAMKLLDKGGFLFTFSCSGAMDDDLFRKVVDSAAMDAKRDYRITHFLSQASDHPVSGNFPEGRYLKGFGGIVF